jgi:hypothetical protein
MIRDAIGESLWLKEGETLAVPPRVSRVPGMCLCHLERMSTDPHRLTLRRLHVVDTYKTPRRRALPNVFSKVDESRDAVNVSMLDLVLWLEVWFIVKDRR